MIPTLVVVIVAAVPPAVPAVFQHIHAGSSRQLADFFQNRLIHRLAVAGDSTGVYFQGCKQNVLLGIHDGQHIFEALRCVLACVHMNVHTARRIDLSACTAQGADNLLQLFHLIVFQLGGVQLDFILARSRGAQISFRVNACVPNDFPLFTVQIFDTCPVERYSSIQWAALRIV